jgi:hypothetical protein
MRLVDQGMTEEQLAARTEHVLGMVDNAGYRVYLRSLLDRLDDIEKKILSGDLSNDEYLKYCGELKGVRFAIDEPDRLIGKAPEQEPRRT